MFKYHKVMMMSKILYCNKQAYKIYIQYQYFYQNNISHHTNTIIHATSHSLIYTRHTITHTLHSSYSLSPDSVWRTSPLSTFHIFTVLSNDPDTTLVPSGEKATELTSPL